MKSVTTVIKFVLLGLAILFVCLFLFIMPTLNGFYGPTTYRPAASLFEALFIWSGNDWANFKTKWSPYGNTYLKIEVENSDLKCAVSTFVARPDIRWKLNYSELGISEKKSDDPVDAYLKIRHADENPEKFQLAFDKDFQTPVFPEYATPQSFAGGNKDMYCMKLVLNEKDDEGNRHFYCQIYYEPPTKTLTWLFKKSQNEFEVHTGACKSDK